MCDVHLIWVNDIQQTYFCTTHQARFTRDTFDKSKGFTVPTTCPEGESGVEAENQGEGK